MNTHQSISVAPPGEPMVSADSVRLKNDLHYDHIRVEGVSEQFYDLICGRMGFPDKIAPGLLAHFAGISDGTWEVIDVWRNVEDMESAFRNYLADAASWAIARSGERADVEPEMREIARLVVGPSAAAYNIETGAGAKTSTRSLRPVATLIEKLGGGVPEYLAGCELLGFPDQIPDGLVLHMAGDCADGWRVFDCWNSVEQCESWNERVADAITTVDAGSGTMSETRFRRIELVRAFVNPKLTSGGYLPT